MTSDRFGVQPRRYRGRLLRALGVLLVAMVGGYVTLPWWLPTEVLRQKITQQLASEFGRRVTMGPLRVGWREGVVIEKLTIRDVAGSPVEVLASVGRVHCGFQPLQTLLTGRVDAIDIAQLELFLAVDESGRLNAADLAEREGGSLPTHRFRIDALSCQVQTPSALEVVRIDHLGCELDPKTGVLNLVGEVRPQRPTAADDAEDEEGFTTRAQVTVPRLKPGVSLGGSVEFRWKGLSLPDLPLGLIPQIPVEQVAGSTTGHVTLETHPDLGIDFETGIVLDGVRVKRIGYEHIWQIDNASVQGRGHWDPSTDCVVMRSFNYETDVFQMAGVEDDTVPALRVEPGDDNVIQLHGTGRVKQWGELIRRWPELAELSGGSALQLHGSADFGVDLDRRGGIIHLLLSCDAGETSFAYGPEREPIVRYPAGVLKRLTLKADVEGVDRRQVQSHLSLEAGGVSVLAQGGFEVDRHDVRDGRGLARRWLEEVVPTLQAEVTVECKHLEEFGQRSDWLAQKTSVADWRGPLRASLNCKGKGETSEFQLALSADQDSVLRIKDVFEKAAGKPLAVVMGCDFSVSEALRLERPVFELVHGDGRVELDRQQAELACCWPMPGGPAFEDIMAVPSQAAWTLPIRFENVEQVTSLWPGWGRFIATDAGRKLVGSMMCTWSGALSTSKDGPTRQMAVDLVADDLAVCWDDLLDKPADVPLRVQGAHRFVRQGSNTKQTFSTAVEKGNDRIAGQLEYTDASSELEPLFERFAFKADIEEVAGWLAISPRLAEKTRSYGPAGGMRVECKSVTRGDDQHMECAFDATGAAFEIRPIDLTKKAGVPATASFTLQTEPAESCWRIERGSAQLAGVFFEEIAGSIVTKSPSGRLSRPMLAMLEQREFPAIERSLLSVRSQVALDEGVRQLQPGLAKWCDRYDLGGQLAVELECRTGADTVSLSGRANADGLQMRADLDHQQVPTIRKKVGMPAEIAFDVSVDRSYANTVHVNAEQLTLSLGSNQAGGHGIVEITRGSNGTMHCDALDAVGYVLIDQANALPGYLPGAAVRMLGGRLGGSLSLCGAPGAWSVGPGYMDLQDFRFGVGGESITLNGAVAFDRDRVNITQLGFDAASVAGSISADMSIREQGTAGQVGMTLDHLDLDALSAAFADTEDKGQSATGTASDSIKADNSTIIRSIVKRLRDVELTLDINVDHLDATLPPNQKIKAEVASARMEIMKGPLEVEFCGVVDGGKVDGEFISHTQVSEPTFHLTYKAEAIEPGALVDGYLRVMFPGMVATGPLTLIDESYQKLMPLPGDPNYEVGEGEFSIEGGSIEGRAAPQWMTRIFPSLNLAKFDFSYMHSWFKKMPSGRVHHQMIYHGTYYDLYMIGHSDPDGRFRYEVGVDFLANFDSQYWADSGQGRIPLFIKDGRMDEQGKLIDERVNYVSPDRILTTLFVRNNPLLTAYLAVQKRIRGEQ